MAYKNEHSKFFLYIAILTAIQSLTTFIAILMCEHLIPAFNDLFLSDLLFFGFWATLTLCFLSITIAAYNELENNEEI